MKRFTGLLLALVMLLSFLPAGAVEAKATGTLTLAQLREKFPHGKYWNHAGNPGSSNSVNNQDGYTSQPCSKHGVIGTGRQTCNGFAPEGRQLSWQCMGYAEKLGYDATGYNPRNNGNGWYTYENVSALNNLKPGDIVRYSTHSIYVTGVNGNIVTFTDCNYVSGCGIRWDATITMEKLRASFQYVRSAPSAMASQPVDCGCSEDYAGTYTCTTSTSYLNIRSGHNTSYGIVSSIPPKATVQVTKASGTGNSDWAHVEYNGVSGYASMQYLKKQTEVPEAKMFDLAGANMALGNSLTMNLYVNQSDVATGDYYMTITKSYADGRADAVKTVAMADWVSYGTMYRVSFSGIAAKEMTDAFSVTVYREDGTQASNTKVFSIRDYALSALNSTDTSSHNLMADMLNYGAAAQKQFGYAVDDLANTGMTPAQKACATQNFSMDQFSNNASKGSGFMGSNLTLESSISLNFYFDPSLVDNTMTARVSYTDHNGKAVSYEIPGSKFTVLSGYGYYGVEVATMAAADARRMVTVEILDGGNVVAKGSTSVESYAVVGGVSNPLYVELMKFCTAAYNYFH